MSLDIPEDQARSKKTSELLFENLVSFAEWRDDLKDHFAEITLRKFSRQPGFPKEKISGRIYVDPVKAAHWLKRRK